MAPLFVRRGLLGLSIGLMAVVATACSTASYQKQTEALSGGLTAAKESFAALSDEHRSARLRGQIRTGLQDGGHILPPAQCRVLMGTNAVGKDADIDCVPQIYNSRTRELKPVAYQAVAVNGLRTSKLLADYGTALSELAAAQDIVAIKEASGKVSAALTGLATVTVPVAVPAAASILNMVNWLFGLYLDIRRLEALKSAVERAAPLIAKAASVLADEAVELQKGVVSQRSADLGYRLIDLERTRKSGKVDRATLERMAHELVDESLALNAYAKSDVTKPFKLLRTAHEELLKSLDNPSVEPRAAFEAIQEFAKHINAIRSAVKKEQ